MSIPPWHAGVARPVGELPDFIPRFPGEASTAAGGRQGEAVVPCADGNSRCAHVDCGGYYKAVEAADRAGCDCVQIFTKNNNQWRAKELTDDDCERFRTAIEELGISHPIAHKLVLDQPGQS